MCPIDVWIDVWIDFGKCRWNPSTNSPWNIVNQFALIAHKNINTLGVPILAWKDACRIDAAFVVGKY